MIFSRDDLECVLCLAIDDSLNANETWRFRPNHCKQHNDFSFGDGVYDRVGDGDGEKTSHNTKQATYLESVSLVDQL